MRFSTPSLLVVCLGLFSCGPIKFTAIADTTDAGFFSLRAHAGLLFCGTYGTPRCYTWDGSAWNDVTGPLSRAGESLFAMTPFSVDGLLYGVTENTGKIFRWDGASWGEIFDTGDRHINAYSIVEFQGYLFTGFRDFPGPSFRVLRSSNGTSWETVWTTTDITEGRFVAYRGDLYMLGVNDRANRAVAYRTGSATGAFEGPVFELDGRSFHGRHVVFDGKLFIATEEAPYNAGGIGSVYAWDGSRLRGIWAPKPEEDVQGIGSLQAHAGRLYALTRTGWRTPGQAKLYEIDPDGGGDRVWTFDEPEGWCMEVYRGRLYVGTRQEGGGGKVYRSNDP